MKMKELEQILKNEPKYRLKQCYDAIFHDLISDWQDVTSLPAILRNKLSEKFSLNVEVTFFESKNKKTVKALVELSDGIKIEAVLMKHKNRNTVCVSSQVGCALGCTFCATGKAGFKRDLSSWEIVLQVLAFARLLKKDNKRVDNVVFMGMGEPFLNYKNVMEAIRVLNDDDGLNIGARHISISTAGLVEGIEKLANEELQVNLAVSLHAPNDDLRKQLMPISRKYLIDDILVAVDVYIEKTGRKVMFEYLLIDGINDENRHAQALAKLMRRRLYVLNLIPCNPVGQYRPSPSIKVEKFKNILEKKGVSVTQRYRFGQDIKGACGQLAGE